MTATPIPRTLTLTVYGDLDVSVLDELPPGRKPVRTHWKRSKDKASVYEGVRKLLAEGRQAYVVCPLVEESEKLQARAATELASHLAQHVFPEFGVGLLHGQLSGEEKDEVMRRFRQGDVHLLVATTVIEVGVDVSNAAVMVIEDADRFGLAQLHQLRGRVGRGAHASFCVLIADPKTPEGEERMRVVAAEADGFRIAEADLRLRGPGEFYGVRQSGLPALRIADVVRDVEVLKEARAAAFDLLRRDPRLSRPEHRALREAAAAQGRSGRGGLRRAAAAMITAVYPGSFDPVTAGHVDVIARAAQTFDALVVAVGRNAGKAPLFSVEERVGMLGEVCAPWAHVTVDAFEGMLVQYARERGARVLVKGLRAVSDFEYEFQMALANKQLAPDIETLFMMTSPEYLYLSSSIVKEIARLGGDVSALVPAPVLRHLRERLGPRAQITEGAGGAAAADAGGDRVL
jgi:pantetheine-phosphate adenylyltransferase